MIYSIGQILDGELRIVSAHQGGMAIVYIVENLENQKKMAAKTVREEFLSDPVMVARFRREMKIWVGLGGHPNVVRAFRIKDIGAQPFLFMEYIDGGSLADLLKKTGPPPFDQLLGIAAAIADGMSYVHNVITSDGLRGIIHRDLKPSNIMASKQGKIKIADFGLARAVDATVLTQTCDALGTVPYVSPEQLFDLRNADRRTDIYSFGALLYHAACGVPPFAAEAWSDLVRKIRNIVPPAPSELRKDIPEPFSRMIMKCLAKQKEGRFKDFGEISVCLSELVSSAECPASPGEVVTKKVNEILDKAEQEATLAGCGSVEPSHVLLAVLSEPTGPISSWLSEMQIDEETFLENVRTFVTDAHPGGSPENVRFKPSTRRAVGLARTWAEQDGLTSPHCGHILKALLEEPSVQDIMAKALNLFHARTPKIERLFELLKRSRGQSR